MRARVSLPAPKAIRIAILLLIGVAALWSISTQRFVSGDLINNLWLMASITMLVAMIWLAGGKRRPPPALFGLSVLSVFLFPPVLSHLMLGQFTVLATLALLLATHLITVPNYVMAGFLVAVALSKPQLAVLVVPGLFLAVGRLFRVRGLLSFAGTLALWSVLLTLPLWIAHAQWANDFLSAQGQNPGQ